MAEGKGTFYFNNGDKQTGNYLNGRKVGKHVILRVNSNIVSNIFYQLIIKIIQHKNYFIF